MAEISKQALIVENNTSFPNNNNGEISPSDLRSFNVDMIDSTVNQTTYTSNSASWNASIDALEQFTSSQQPSFTALNQFTASQIGINSALTGFTSSADARLDALELETTALESFTASINQIQERGVIKGISTRLNFGGGAFVTASIVANVGGAIADIIINSDTTKTGTGSFNAFTQSYLNDSASFDSRIDSLESFSSSLDVTYVTQAELASATGALEDSIDTKLNTSSFNSYTQSNDDKVNSLIAFTSSVLSIAALVPLNNFTASIAGTNAFTQSAAVSIAALNAATSSYAISSSVAAVDAAQQTQINNLTSATSSYVTESETGSFARTNVDNNFSANQTFTNITAVSASFTYVKTTYETSSVIYSSGSNQLGDELTDVQILSGSVKVVGGLTLNGVNVITSADTASYIQDLGPLNAFSASTNVFTASIAGTNTFTASIADTNAFTASATLRLNSLESTSASVNTSIASLNGFTASVAGTNTFTASAANSIASLNSATASYAISASVAAVDLAQQNQIDVLIAATASYVTSAITASSLVTASFDNGTRNLTFTKGDASTFAVNIPDVSGSTFDTSSLVTTSSFNAYTQSNDGRVNALETFSASALISINSLNNATQSLFVSASLALVTASVNNDDITFTKGDGTQFTIQVATGSFAVSASYAETASYAQFATDIYLQVKNTTGAQINKGTVVRIIGATGDNALIATASWENDNNSANTLGFLYENIANDSFGKVITQGTLLGINTDPTLGYTAGQILYLSSSGQYTNVIPPAPYHEVRLGQVLRAQQNNGSIYILIQNGYELGELHDVDILTGSLANNDLLAYNSASGQWENKSISVLGIATTASFNSYTSSTNARLNSLETTSASVSTSITNLNQATESLNTSASLALVTASINNFTNTITFTKGNGTTFDIIVQSGSISGIDTGSFATTGSNTFVGVNTFNERTSLQSINVYTGSTSGIYIGNRTNFAPTTAGNVPGDAHTVIGNGALGSFGNGDLNTVFGRNALANLISGSSNLAMGGFAGLALVNGNTNTFIGDQAGNGMKGGDNNFFLGSSAGNNFRTGSFNIMIGLNTQGTLATGSGNLFIGNQNGTLIQNNIDNQLSVVYGTDLAPRKLLFKSGSEASNLYLYGGLEVQNTFTASIAQGFMYVGNASGRTQAISTSSFVLPNQTGSFATTGSNAFIGNQTITGVLSISSSAAFDLDITGGFKATAASQISGSQGILSLGAISVQVSGSAGNNVMGRGYYDASINTNKIAIYSSGSSAVGGFTTAPLGTCGIAVQSGSVLTNYYYPIQFQGSTQYTDGRVTIATPLSASAGFTGSLNVNGSSTFNGNSLITGSLTVSGSATITGSVSVSNVLKLAALDPLPSGADGQLAVSASNLYFFSGSAWNKIAFA